jgi:hypothetical protein
MQSDRYRGLALCLFLILVVWTAQPSLHAQTLSPKEALLGIWRGTSICVRTPGNEACKDEIVVYEFVDRHQPADSVTLNASKVVDGIIEPMGELGLHYRPGENRWVAEFRNSRVHVQWAYEVFGSRIAGSCVDLPSLNLRRNVAVTKDSLAAPHTLVPPPKRQ